MTQTLGDLQSSHDEVYSTVDDVSTSQTDTQNSVDELSQTAGQLQFPLSQDSIDLINEAVVSKTVTGTVALVAGSATIADTNIVPTSSGFLTPKSAGWAALESPTFYVFSIGTGSAVVKSTSATDSSVLAYMIIP